MDTETEITIAVPAALLQRLTIAGGMLANCAFNLAQREGKPLEKRIADSLRDCQIEWDDARRKLREATDA